MFQKNYSILAFTFGFLPYPIYDYKFLKLWHIQLYVSQNNPIKFNLFQAVFFYFLFTFLTIHRVEIIKWKGKYQ